MPTNPITQTIPQQDSLIIHLTGTINVVNAPELRVGLLERIKQYSPKELVLDLSEVDFVDSSGLGVFIEARRHLSKDDGAVTFANVREEIRGLMRVMNLDAVFQFVDDES